MPVCEVIWNTNPRSNCAYAVTELLRATPLADVSRQNELTEHIDQLRRSTRQEDTWLAGLFAHLVPLYATPEGNRYVVETALRKFVGGTPDARMIDDVFGAVHDLLLAWNQSFPKFESDSKLRAAVVQEHWAARGPGLLSSIERFTEDELIPAGATVLLVDPLFGGGGAVYVLYNTVAIEAVLANPYPDVPEIVRLAWMIAQLQMEAPVLSETVHGSKLPRLAALAALPPALQAAEVVELCQFSPALVARAIELWKLPVEDCQLAADALVQWWKAYQRDRPRWSVALAALDQVL